MDSKQDSPGSDNKLFFHTVAFKTQKIHRMYKI